MVDDLKNLLEKEEENVEVVKHMVTHLKITLVRPSGMPTEQWIMITAV